MGGSRNRIEIARSIPLRLRYGAAQATSLPGNLPRLRGAPVAIKSLNLNMEIIVFLQKNIVGRLGRSICYHDPIILVVKT